ncbi:MAG TPA: ATP-binding protein [Hyphomicrobiaceae bacterium]|nr:ATP-binding protein [Hyphomicrobiaceae bacterium]
MADDAVKKSRRSISDEEIALIKAMLRRGMGKTTILSYFTHPDRPVNYGRISNIEQGTYGPDVVAANDAELDKYLEEWHRRGEVSSQVVAEHAVDVSSLGPVDPRRLATLFDLGDDGRYILRGGETDEVECKQSFHGPGHDRLLRAVAALANNKGGYVLYGVENATGVLLGLKDDRLKNTDPSQFTQAIRSAMEPCPRFEVGSVELGSAKLGAIYVHPEAEAPVISTKDADSFKAGVVYFRYPGESRAISGPDFRRLLASRDKRARQEAAELARRVVELGSDAALLDLKSGQIEGRTGSLFVSPDLLQKMQFIREGEFVQKDGAAALRIVGDVSVANSPADVLVREKIVLHGITDWDVLDHFLKQERVQHPAAFVLHSCHSNKRWLPIFFYVRQIGRPTEEIVELARMEETTHTAARGALLDRLGGRVSAHTRPSHASATIIKQIGDGTLPRAETLTEIGKQAVAIQGWTDRGFDLEQLLQVLSALRARVKELSSDANRSSQIRKAAAWLDELYFRDATQTASAG